MFTADSLFLFVGCTSTRLPWKVGTFRDAAIQGIAPGSGLFVNYAPVPYWPHGQWKKLIRDSYSELVLKVLERWITPGDISRKVCLIY